MNVAVSFTVLEEGNADRMLAELVRVAKPGGRVAVMVRALDIPWVVNVPLRPEVKTKAETPRGFVGAQGCADASLYRRLHQAGLTHVKMFPQLAASDQPETPQAQFAYGAILGALTAEETQEWHAGMAQAVAEDLFYCPAVSLRRRDKARDGGMTDKAKEIWVSGEAYEQYVGRWSRKVAREFLAGLKSLEGKRGETSAAELVLSSTRSSPGMNRRPSWPSTGRTDSSPRRNMESVPLACSSR